MKSQGGLTSEVFGRPTLAPPSVHMLGTCPIDPRTHICCHLIVFTAAHPRYHQQEPKGVQRGRQIGCGFSHATGAARQLRSASLQATPATHAGTTAFGEPSEVNHFDFERSGRPDAGRIMLCEKLDTDHVMMLSWYLIITWVI